MILWNYYTLKFQHIWNAVETQPNQTQQSLYIRRAKILGTYIRICNHCYTYTYGFIPPNRNLI